ncbi:YgcG family protein [Flammeovirga sp. SJP92]|uniref:TPM domain-containing protein n=1 Tax=Flammeovirga sp. SJP92 TaxID=1775430 RepID=UPI000788E394|nr:TPM domain-containing protein [Flammeovirga sp. SJP92]KXX72277.1 hypothetical protein AVL50_01360 [Flammeovirga sp. SJP92]
MFQLIITSLKVNFLLCLLLWSIAIKASTVDNYVNQTFQENLVVNDYANFLSKSDLDILRKKVSSINSTSNIEYAVCFVQDLNGFDKKDLASALANYWNVGKTHYGEGVLILISIANRSVFVATSKVTERRIPNAKVKVYVDKFLIPNLKVSNYKKGVLSTISEFEGLEVVKKEKEKSNPFDKFSGLLSFIAVFVGASLIIFKIVRRNSINSTHSTFFSSSDGGGSGDSNSGDFDGGGAGGDF